MLAARNAPLRASSDPINGSAHPLNLSTFSHRSLAMLPLIPFSETLNFSPVLSPRALLSVMWPVHFIFLCAFMVWSEKFISAFFLCSFAFAFTHSPMIKNNQSPSFLNPPVFFPASVVSQSAKCWLHSPLTYHLINLTLTIQLSWYLKHISQWNRGSYGNWQG